MTYAQLTALSRSNYNQAYRRKKTSVPLVKTDALKSMSNFIIILLLVCVLIIIYLFQVNTTNSYSYVINDLNEQREQLQEEYQVLQIEATKLVSNERVTNQNLSTDYQLPENIYFD